MTSVYRVRVGWTGLAGTEYLSTFHFAASGPSLGAAQLAVDQTEVFLTSMASVIVNDLTWESESEVVVIDTTTGFTTAAFATTPFTDTGEGTGDPVPRAAMLMARWQTGVFVGSPSRRLRGRTFIPGINEVNNDAGGKPSAALQAQLQAAADAFLGGDPELRIYSRAAATDHPVVSASVWDEWAILRSRRD